MARTGCIFMEMTDAPGRLEATYFVQMDFHGSAPKAMYVHGMRRHIRAILPTVESFILIALLRDAAFFAKLVPTSARRACHVCDLMFGAFHRRRRCRKCGDVVCTSCSSHVTFDQHLDSLKLRICTACVMHVLLPDEFPNPTRSSSQLRLHHDSNDDDEVVTVGRNCSTGQSQSHRRSHSSQIENKQKETKERRRSKY
ncbi:hypothetical protein H257_13256 [Aphanomyces astaci]|uniref:FYVE-type domain-containing protein n=1 Tax=Aphanomyces astaci TaxID=112090 RepID=W4FV38_APHAT|nr:hypothetical protein H257_13256 [Aphanomyces astaci]ETV71357.1 hypothetical protein H257_13256 [Aphanomyces astaci]|eukprot:XP_009839022.1 hypothetical protein H257_13256 [Aphanomyces astaci]